MARVRGSLDTIRSSTRTIGTAPGPALRKKPGLAKFRFHDLRHTFITQMVERGVPLGLIQAMVGHISSRMLRHYTHISSGAARKAVEALDAEPILAPSITEQQPVQAQRVYRA